MIRDDDNTYFEQAEAAGWEKIDEDAFHEEGIWLGFPIERTIVRGRECYSLAVTSEGERHDFLPKEKLLEQLAARAEVEIDDCEEHIGIDKEGDCLQSCVIAKGDYRSYFQFVDRSKAIGCYGIYSEDRNETLLIALTRKRSPWGEVQTQTMHGHPRDKKFGQVYTVSTASHGGVFCKKAANEQIPDYMRSADGWYEEDCDWSIPATVHVDLFPHLSEEALSTLANWHPESWEKFTGKSLEPGMSYQRDSSNFYRSHANDFIVVAAWSDTNPGWPHPDFPVPNNWVGVVGALGGGRLIDVPRTERISFVPLEEYNERPRFGFVIDPARHLTPEEFYERQGASVSYNSEESSKMNEDSNNTNRPVAKDDSAVVWRNELPSGGAVYSIVEEINGRKSQVQMDSRFYEVDLTGEEALHLYRNGSLQVTKTDGQDEEFDCAICLDEVVTKPSTGSDGKVYENNYANLTPVFFRTRKEDGELFGYRVPCGKDEPAVDFYRTVGSNENPVELSPRDCVRLSHGESLDKPAGKVSLKEVTERSVGNKTYHQANCWIDFKQKQTQEQPEHAHAVRH